jgi:hypothetical protein
MMSITIIIMLLLVNFAAGLQVRTAARMLSKGDRALLMSTAETQRTLAEGSHSSEMEVKKSRFIGYAKHAENWSEAQTYIDEIKSLHPKARHWCYGLCCGVNPVSERCSDDGEPTGTAGQPILGAINGENLSDVICIVVRYFGTQFLFLASLSTFQLFSYMCFNPFFSFLICLQYM